MLREDKFIIEGKLPLSEVKLLLKDMSVYSSMAERGSLTSSLGVRRDVPRHDDNVRKCKVYFPQHDRFPITTNILHSLLIEYYYNIYKHLDFSKISSFQYVSYNKGEFFKKHNDVVQNHTDVFRALTMSINLSDPAEYSGGSLVVYDKKDEVICSLGKEVGSFIIIPAFLTHEAQVVEDGKREAIVTWLHCNMAQLNQFRNEYYSRVHTT